MLSQARTRSSSDRRSIGLRASASAARKCSRAAARLPRPSSSSPSVKLLDALLRAVALRDRDLGRGCELAVVKAVDRDVHVAAIVLVLANAGA